MLKISIVIPFYNERIHLVSVINKIRSYQKECEIVFVDDGSTDGSYELVASEIKESKIHLLQLPVNLGKGAALLAGCDFSFGVLGASYVILMDSDEQHSIEDIQIFLNRIKQGDTLILGIRDLSEMPTLVSLVNSFASWFLQLLSGVNIPDIPSGFKAFDKEVFKLIQWDGGKYDVELVIARKIALKKIPFSTVSIRTIYHDYPRGMTALDGLKVVFRLMGF